MRTPRLYHAERRRLRRATLGLPRYTLMEEIVNAISHGLGAVFAVVALVLLILRGPKDPIMLVGDCIFGVTMFLLYTVSTVYHALGVNRAKKVFQVLDHCTIYLLIAGTYTPITLACLEGWNARVLLAIVWGVAAAGILVNAIAMKRFKVLSMISYLGLGWCVVFFLKPLVATIAKTDLILLVTGGVLYTIGAVLYGTGKKIPYMHSIWHLFCVAGSVFHFLVIYHLTA